MMGLFDAMGMRPKPRPAIPPSSGSAAPAAAPAAPAAPAAAPAQSPMGLDRLFADDIDRRLKLSAIGDVLIALSRPNGSFRSPAYEMALQRQMAAKKLEALKASGLWDELTPDQRQLFELLPPDKGIELVANIMAQKATQSPYIKVGDMLIDRTTGKPVYAPPRVVGDALVDPLTGKPIYKNESDRWRPLTPEEVKAAGLPPGGAWQINEATGKIAALVKGADERWETLSAEQAKALGLDPNKAWQRDAVSGKIRPVDSSPMVSITNVPKPPAGYVYEYDAQGRPIALKPLPGSEAESEARREVIGKSAEAARIATQLNAALDIGQRALTLMEQSPWATTGVGGALLSKVPGTDAYELDRLLESLKSMAKIITLQSLREASKNGASGLGQLTEKENEMLADLFGRLDPALGAEYNRPIIERIVSTLMLAKERAEKQANEARRRAGLAGGRPNGGTAPQTAPEARPKQAQPVPNRIEGPGGYWEKGEDGVWRWHPKGGE